MKNDQEDPTTLSSTEHKPTDSAPAQQALPRLTDRELYDNSCITRYQLKNWVDSDYRSHVAGLKHTIEFLLARLDATAVTSTERCDGADDLEHLDGMLDDRERG